ncbi:MAG TPA: FadR/GntR family transcriptional regulator [Anaerolineae bacterium]
MTFGTIKKNTLSEEIVDRLLCLIKKKKLNPGDKLPPERELAATMQVSRSSLREALRALSILNIIEIRQGGGIYITSLDLDLLSEPLEFILSLDASAFSHLICARKIIEPGIAALATVHITDEELQALDQELLKSGGLLDDPDANRQIDLKIHELITTATRNPILSRIQSSLVQLSRASCQRTAHIPAAREQAYQDHQAILAALKSRDPDAAHKAMLQHLVHIEKYQQYPE